VLYGDEPATVRDLDAVAQICQVALRVERYTWLIFPDEFGMDEPERPIGRVLDAEILAEWQADIRETILAAHERVTDVKNFKIELDDDGGVLLQAVDVIVDDEVTVTIAEVTLV
jgi:hypothetical protein